MARVVVIGNLSVLIKALNVMRDCGTCDVALVVTSPHLRDIGNFVPHWCQTNGIDYCCESKINSPEMIERISALTPDFIFSIYNPYIIRAPLLAIPKVETVNFHAGPLPTYRGMNTFSWAIINGERKYGVAWHAVDEGIDTGHVLFQRSFDLPADETALSLSKKSFDAGVDLLRERIDALMDGTLIPEGTPDGPSTYYARGDIPNEGLINFNWSVDQIDRFVRGLNYYPVPNPFVMASASFSGLTFHPLRVARVDARDIQPQPGKVLAIEEAQIVVQVGDGAIGIREALNDRLRKRSPVHIAQELGLEVGAMLSGR